MWTLKNSLRDGTKSILSKQHALVCLGNPVPSSSEEPPKRKELDEQRTL